MEADDPPDELPPGRDWLKDVRIGVHGYPSMNHMHIHIMSRDSNSSSVTKATHYNSFNTRFFVPLEDFPLKPDDDRWQPDELKRIKGGDMICWKCGKNYGRSFVKLKAHLYSEYREWRKI
jgi:aprataxin